MLTLDQLLNDRRFGELDTEAKKQAIDQFYADENTDKTSGAAQDGAFFLKKAFELSDKFDQETEARKPYVGEQAQALASYRDRIRKVRAMSQDRLAQRFGQGLDPESKAGRTIFQKEQELFKESSMKAANEYAAEEMRISRRLAEDYQFENRARGFARRFLLNNPQTAERQRERETEGVFGSIGEFVTDVAEAVGSESKQQRDERSIAFAEREELMRLIEEREGLPMGEGAAQADQIIAEEEAILAQETEGGFYTSRSGEIEVTPLSLARLTEDEIKSQVESMEAPKAAKDRFLGNLEALRKDAAEMTAETFKRGVASGMLELRSREQILQAERNRKAEAQGKELPFPDAPMTSQDVIGAADFEDPDKIRELINRYEDEEGGLSSLVRNFKAGAAGITGGALSAGLTLLGKDQDARYIAQGAAAVEQGAAVADELANLNAFQKFAGDIGGTVPDLLLAAAGAQGAKAVNALFGATGKTAATVSLAGVSAGSGLGSGLRTFNEAIAKGLDPSTAFRLGAESFLITSAVTAAGGRVEGVEGVLTGGALMGVKKGFKEYLGTVLKGARNDSIEELADTVISSFTVQQELNPNMTIAEHVKGALEAATLGAALGGGLPAIVNIPSTEFRPSKAAENRRKAELGDKLLNDPTSLTDKEVEELRDTVAEELLNLTQGEKTRKALAEQRNRDRLERGEPVESVEQNPTRPEGTPAVEATEAQSTEAQPTEATEAQPTEATEAQPTEATEAQPTEATPGVQMEERDQRDNDFFADIESGDRGNDNLREALQKAPLEQRQAVLDAWLGRNYRTSSKLKEMVKGLAKAAGYNLEAVHGGQHGIDAFDAERIKNQDAGAGFYFSTDVRSGHAEGYAERIGGKVYEVFLRHSNPYYPKAAYTNTPVKDPKIFKQTMDSLQKLYGLSDKDIQIISDFVDYPINLLTASNEFAYQLLLLQDSPKFSELSSKAQTAVITTTKTLRGEQGMQSLLDTIALLTKHDGIIYRDGSVATVLNPAQIKSSAPITLDANGNIIPPSQRFDRSSPDIRFEEPTTPRKVETTRFNELTADLYEGNPEPTAEDIAAWREANPEKWQELSEMRERVLREAGYDSENFYHGTVDIWTVANTSDRSKSFDTPNAFGDNIGLFVTNRKGTAEYFARTRNSPSRTKKTYDMNYPDGAVIKNAFDTIEEAESFLKGRQGFTITESSSPVKATEDEQTVYKFRHKIKNPKKFSSQAKFLQAVRSGEVSQESLILEGHDGVLIQGSDLFSKREKWFVVFDPTQIKSADPISPGPKVTPDQWADTSSPDIRFEEPQESQPRESNENEEQKIQGQDAQVEQRQSPRNRGEADQGSDTGTDQGAEVRPQVAPEGETQVAPEGETQVAPEGETQVAPGNTSTYPEGSDQDVFNRALQALRDTGDPAIQQVAETLELVENPPERFARAAKLAEFFGRRVLVVRGTRAPNGFFNQQTPDTIFLNENADRAEFQVVAHEILHSFQANNPEGYQRLVDAVDADLDTYVSQFPQRGRGGRGELKNEFLADFMADSLINEDFLARLATEEPTVFEEFADFVLGLIQKLKDLFRATKDLGTRKLIRDLDKAEAALIDLMQEARTGQAPARETGQAPARETGQGPARETGQGPTPQGGREPFEPGTGSSRDPLRQDDKLRQIQGVTNILSPKDRADLEGAKAIIDTEFNSAEIPLTPSGEAEARAFLAKLTDPTYIRSLIDKIKAETENTEAQARAIASAAAESAFFNFAARYAAQNKKAGSRLIYDGFRLRRDIYQEGTTGGSLEEEAYERALFLRAIQAYPGGSMVRFFRLEIASRLEDLRAKTNPETAELADKVRKEELNEAELQETVEDVFSRDLAEEQKKLAKAEERVWQGIRALASILRGTSEVQTEAPTEIRFEESSEDPVARFLRLADEGTDYEAALDAFDEVLPILAKKVGEKKAAQAQKIAQKTAIDRYGAGLIRRAKALGEVKARTEDPSVKELREFIATKPTKEAFIAKYEELGGTKDQAASVYEAQQKIDAAEQERKQKVETEKAQAAAEKAEARRQREFDRVQALVDQVGEEKAPPKRTQAERDDTFQSLISEFTNLERAEQTQDQLEARLAALTNRKGEPLLTQSQVEQASTRAVMARQAAKDAKAADLALEDAKKRDADADRFAARVEREALKAEKQRLDKARKDAEKAEKKKEKTAERVKTLIDKMKGQVKKTTPKKHRITVNKIVNDFINLRKPEQDSSDLTSQLFNLFDTEGRRVLTDPQVKELVDTAVQARRKAAAAQEADRQARDMAREVERAEKLFDSAKRRTPRGDLWFARLLFDELVNRDSLNSRVGTEQQTLVKTLLGEKTKLTEAQIEQLIKKVFNPDPKKAISKELKVAKLIFDELVNAPKTTLATNQAKIAFVEKLLVSKAGNSKAEAKDLAEAIFGNESEAKGPETRSVAKIIMDEYINNPRRKISNRDERIAFVKEVLAEKTKLPQDKINELAEKLESKLADRLYEKKKKIADKILKTLVAGRSLSQEQIDNAVRLEIFDPKEDFVTSLAAELGWEGLTEKQTNRLLELQRKIDLAPQERTVPSFYREMARIIVAASGKSPSFNKVAGDWFSAAIFSAISTQTVGITAGASALVQQLATESLFSLSALTRGEGIVGVFKDLGNVWKEWLKAFKPMVLEAFNALDGSAFAQQFNVEQERTGRTLNEGVDANVHINNLTKMADLLSGKLPKDWAAWKADKLNIKKAKRVVTHLLRVGFLMRSTFIALGAVDSAVSKGYTRAQNNILRYRENRELLAQKEGVTPQELQEVARLANLEAQAAVQAFANQGLFEAEGKLDALRMRTLAQTVYADIVDRRLSERLVRGGVNPEIPAQTLKDIQAQIGTGDFDKTLLATVGQEVSKFAGALQRNVFFTKAVLVAVRTPVVVMDYLAYWTPIINIGRGYDLFVKRKRDPDGFANKYPSISADWVANRRKAAVIASHPLGLLLYAMFQSEDEDKPLHERDFAFTGDYPDSPAERDYWRQYGIQPNTLKLGPLNLRVDKGVLQSLFGPLLISKAISDSQNLDENGLTSEGLTRQESYARSATALGLAFAPSADQIFELGADVKRRQSDTVGAVQAFGIETASRAVPFSGALKSIGRALPYKVDNRNSMASLLVNNPLYVMQDGEGVLYMENVLGERLEQSGAVGDVIRRLGVPIFWTAPEKDRDRVNKRILDTFADKEYFGGKLSIPALQKRFEQAGVEFNTANLKTYNDQRIKTFKTLYLQYEDTVKAAPKDDFEPLMKKFWDLGKKAADASFGLRPASRSQ